jgi:hypothetical protein
MRFLPNARIVVLDGDGRRRALICAELVELGLTQVVPAGSAKEAQQLAANQPFDLCVVDPRALGPDSRTKVFPNPFHGDGTLAVLLAADTSVAALEAAAAAGYPRGDRVARGAAHALPAHGLRLAEGAAHGAARELASDLPAACAAASDC